MGHAICHNYYSCKSSHRQSANEHGCGPINFITKGGCRPDVSHRPSVPTPDLEGGWTGIDIQNCREEDFKNLKGSWGPALCLFAKVAEHYSTSSYCFQHIKIKIPQAPVYPRSRPYSCHLLTPHSTCMILHWSLERLESKDEILTRGKAFQSAWLPIASPDPPQACRKS